tara:strand:+ start:167 stop:532 length:366 start_codon:yes stop_codon:yes gene_type:complete
MSKKNVVFEGGVNKVSTLADGSMSINIHTQELGEETMMRLFSLRKTPGIILISPDEITEAEIELVSSYNTTLDHNKGKSPSQRLRAVLYRVWEQSSQRYDFSVWYEKKIEDIIDRFKSTLE